MLETLHSIEHLLFCAKYPALVDMQKYFQTSDTAMNASLAVYTYFLAFFPLIWATFGDLFGRRPIYLVSFLVAVAGMICCSFSTNVVMFIVFRAVSAIGSSSVRHFNIICAEANPHVCIIFGRYYLWVLEQSVIFSTLMNEGAPFLIT